MYSRIFHLEMAFFEREDYQAFLRSKPFAQDGSIELVRCDEREAVIEVACQQRSLAPLMHVCLASGAIPYVDKEVPSLPM